MQVPASFEFERAESVEHALELLERYGPEARLVAGGHSLIPMMKLRLAQPDALIDINGLAELSHLKVTGDTLVIGALVRHAALLADEAVGAYFPIFHEAERVIADPVVRNRGTVGGSLCQADPSEDLSAAFAAVRAEAVIAGPGGRRTVPIREFHVGPYETVVGPGEMLIELRVRIRPGAGSAYEKVERRVGDWPVAAAGAYLRLDGGVIAEVGLGLTAVGAEHFAAPFAEAYLIGKTAGEAVLREGARIAADGCAPQADQRGPVDYKRHLAGELTYRALSRAAERSGS
ncbi:carbon monoxide dehydrogenase medium subunit [Acrocarpospora corrugata]|uniref:Carbon monoxide dehydrogenase medium subunit n=1 Tax=Acrocarpospora corrugata TaxID=35763 RepID=A0A5M3VNG3_9ACTN|nr:xanthine dehydrogenase family protein subunit M [Acrocarpospora corrugata]GER98326.1 carbon monoxide dehydrogenase medium subunit [Acrocarpospora corrugata]